MSSRKLKYESVGPRVTRHMVRAQDAAPISKPWQQQQNKSGVALAEYADDTAQGLDTKKVYNRPTG